MRWLKFWIDEGTQAKFVQFKKFILSRFGVSDRSGILVRYWEWPRSIDFNLKAFCNKRYTKTMLIKKQNWNQQLIICIFKERKFDVLEEGG